MPPPPAPVAEVTTGSEAAREQLPAHVAIAFAALDAHPPCSPAGWCPELPSASTRIQALWIGEREIFALIDSDAVLYWDGERWHREAVPQPENAYREWSPQFAGDPSGVFLMQGQDGVFRRQGDVWLPVADLDDPHVTTLGDGTPVIFGEDRVWIGDPTLEPTHLDGGVEQVWGSSRERWLAYFSHSYDDDASAQFYSSVLAAPSVPRGQWHLVGCFHDVCLFSDEHGRAVHARDGSFEEVASLPFDARAAFVTEVDSMTRVVADGAVADLVNGNWVLRSSPEIGRSIWIFGSTSSHVYAASQGDGPAIVLEGTIRSDVPNETTIAWRTLGALPDAMSEVRVVWARAENNIWVGGSTLAYWDGAAWSEIPLPGPVLAIGGNTEERVWVLADRSLFSIDHVGGLPRRVVHAPDTTRIAVHGEHVFLLDERGALSELREGRIEPLAELGERFWDLLELRSGEVVAAGPGGLDVFDGQVWSSLPVESHVPIVVLRGSGLNDLYLAGPRRAPSEDGEEETAKFVEDLELRLWRTLARSGPEQLVHFDGSAAREIPACAGISGAVVRSGAWVAHCEDSSEIVIGTVHGVNRMGNSVEYGYVLIDAGSGHAFARSRRRDGLFWFDGREWTRVSGSNRQLVPETALIGDERGRLAYHDRSRVTVMDRESAHHLFEGELNSRRIVRGPIFAEDGSIIVGNEERWLSSDGTSWGGPSDRMASIVWARSSADVWACGANGPLHWNGQEWDPEPSPFRMQAASGTESATYIGSTTGFILRLENGTWSYMHLPTDQRIRWIDATSDDDLYALAGHGDTLFHFDGRQWRSRSIGESSDSAQEYWRQGTDLLRSSHESIERCRGCLSPGHHWVPARAHAVSFGEAESVLPMDVWARQPIYFGGIPQELPRVSDPSTCVSTVEAFERGEGNFPRGECRSFFDSSQVMMGPGGRVAWSEPVGDHSESWAFTVREGDRVVDRQELSVATLSPRLTWFEARHREGFRLTERISTGVSVAGPVDASTGMLRGRFTGWVLFMESDPRGYQLRLVAPDNRHAFTVLSRRKSSFWCGARPSSDCVAEVSIPEVFVGDDGLVFVVATTGGEAHERYESPTSRRTYVHVPLRDEMRALMDIPARP